MFGSSLVGRCVRNISRAPGYGLRKRRASGGTARGDEPVGPRLVRGRGRRRRALRTPGVALLLSFVLLMVTVAAIAYWAFRVA